MRTCFSVRISLGSLQSAAPARSGDEGSKARGAHLEPPTPRSSPGFRLRGRPKTPAETGAVPGRSAGLPSQKTAAGLETGRGAPCAEARWQVQPSLPLCLIKYPYQCTCTKIATIQYIKDVFRPHRAPSVDWPEGFRTGVRRGVRSRVRRGSGGNDPPPDPPPVSLCVGTGQINGQ
eukprot:1193007-Prorocentrum_minimum.AAC.5